MKNNTTGDIEDGEGSNDKQGTGNVARGNDVLWADGFSASQHPRHQSLHLCQEGNDGIPTRTGSNKLGLNSVYGGLIRIEKRCMRSPGRAVG